MRITILGCGGSAGVPLVGCECKVCASDNPRNKRTRVSVLVETQGKTLLIDTSPDLRQQALKAKLKHIDAVLFTHAHADHSSGLDDVRSFNYWAKETLPIYADKFTLDELQTRFAYAFGPKPENGIWTRPSLAGHKIREPLETFEAAGVKVQPFAQVHGKWRSLGFRIGDFAYSTDVNELPEDAFKALEGVRIWVVDCLSYKQSYTHSTVAQTLDWIKRVKPELAVLTHMTHDIDYATLAEELPAGAVPGYDGMILEL